MRAYVRGLVDAESLFEIHALWARELVTGFARLDGQVIGVVANNPMFKGGVLFVDSADKATRFIQLCDAFNVPLLFLADCECSGQGRRGTRERRLLQQAGADCRSSRAGAGNAAAPAGLRQRYRRAPASRGTRH